MNFGIAIFPSKKLQDLANSYRKRYDAHYKLIPPHVTLKSTFSSTEEDIKRISAILKDISKAYEPFTLKVLKVSTFQPINNVIYLKIDPNEELVRLHEALHSEELGKEKPYSFIPHLTIGQDLSDKEMHDVLGQLSLMKFVHEEIIDRFHLLYQLDNGTWTVYETFLLGEDL